MSEYTPEQIKKLIQQAKHWETEKELSVDKIKYQLIQEIKGNNINLSDK